MNKLVVLYIGLIFLFACSNEQQLGKTVFEVTDDVKVHEGKVTLSALFPEWRLISLETNDSSLIGGRANKVVQRGSNYYIESQGAILCFGKDGDFIRRIDKKGNGPEDYVEISDFDVIKSESGKWELWISGVNGIKIYDISSGSYLRDIPTGKYVHQFKYVNAHTVLLITSEDKFFQICDLKGNIRKSFMDKDLANSVHKFHQFFNWEGNIAYQLGDTQTAIVYDPTSDRCFMQAILPAWKYALTPEISRRYYEKYGYMEQYKHLMDDYAVLSTIYPVNNKAVFSWIYPGMNYSLMIYSSSACSLFAFSDIVNDIFHSDNNLFLATLLCCDSDDSSTLLFQIPSEGTSGLEEDNFRLLEVKKVTLPF